MIWVALALHLARTPPVDWIVWAVGVDLEVEVAPGRTTAQVAARCAAPPCPPAILHVQGSTPGRRICRWSTLRVRERGIFADGFESGNMRRWGRPPPRPDSDVRLWLPLELPGCAGAELRVTSAGGSEVVRLDSVCRARTIRRHRGDLWARMGSREWRARVTAEGRVAIRRQR